MSSVHGPGAPRWKDGAHSPLPESRGACTLAKRGMVIKPVMLTRKILAGVKRCILHPFGCCIQFGATVRWRSGSHLAERSYGGRTAQPTAPIRAQALQNHHDG